MCIFIHFSVEIIEFLLFFKKLCIIIYAKFYTAVVLGEELPCFISKYNMGVRRVRLRKQELGNRNLVGARVELARKNQGMKQKELLAQLQVSGVDMNASGLSKLEGQVRHVTDFELVALADILNVSVDWLLGRED